MLGRDRWRQHERFALGGLQLHQDRGESLRQVVVDVARQPVAFVEDRLAPLFEPALLGQPALMQRQRRLARDRLGEHDPPPFGPAFGRVRAGRAPSTPACACPSTSGAMTAACTPLRRMNARTGSGRRGSSPVYRTV